MRGGDKGLERKEMRIQKETKMGKLPGEKELATAKKWRRSRNARLASRRACRGPLAGKEPKLETPEQGVRTESKPADTGLVDAFVGYRVDLTIAEVKRLGLRLIERARTAAAKNGKLIAGFIHGAVAVAFGDGQGGTSSRRRGDQLWRWARAEAREMRGIIPGRNKFEDPQAISAVSDESKRAGRDHANFHVVHIVEPAPGTGSFLISPTNSQGQPPEGDLIAPTAGPLGGLSAPDVKQILDNAEINCEHHARNDPPPDRFTDENGDRGCGSGWNHHRIAAHARLHRL